MFNPPRVFATLFLGAVSGLGFYSVSYPVARLSAFATLYFLPSSENTGSTVHKADRLAVAETFEDRWPHVAAVRSASTQAGQTQITAPNCPMA
jgi:hypothetical protein